MDGGREGGRGGSVFSISETPCCSTSLCKRPQKVSQRGRSGGGRGGLRGKGEIFSQLLPKKSAECFFLHFFPSLPPPSGPPLSLFLPLSLSPSLPPLFPLPLLSPERCSHGSSCPPASSPTPGSRRPTTSSTRRADVERDGPRNTHHKYGRLLPDNVV